MLHSLQDFEDLVIEHFRRRGYYILKACTAYMEGYRVGSLDASASCGIRTNSNTTGFKLMLSKLVTKLYTTLRDIGANCEEFKHFENSVCISSSSKAGE